MGYSLEETLNMTWQEFDFNSRGYQRRTERMWDYTRHVIANMYNSSGFSKRTVKAKDIMKLPMLDEVVKKPSRRMDSKTIELMKSRIK